MVQAREFTDGFDLYPDNQSTTGYGILSTWLGGIAGFASGRFAGGRCVYMEFNQQLYRPFVPSTDVVLGFAWRRRNNIGSSGAPICTLRSQNGEEQFTVSYTADFRLQLRRGGSAGTVVAQSDLPAVQANTWHYLQLAFVLGNEGAFANLFVDRSDVAALEFSGDTQGHTDTDVAQLSLRVGDLMQHDFDDVYLESGGHVLVGEGRMEPLPANADVSNTGFTPSTGATLSGVLDEVPASSADYVSASVAGSVFRVGFANLSTVPETIYGVQIENLSQKDEAGTRTGRNKLWSDGVLVNGATLAMQLNSPTFKRDWLKLNPDGNIVWDAAAVNAIEGGFELVV